MKKINKQDVQGYVILVLVIGLLCVFFPMIAFALSVCGLIKAAEFMRHVISGTGVFSGTLAAHERKDVSGMFQRLMKPEIVEDLVGVSYSHIMSCGCEEPIGWDVLARIWQTAVSAHPEQADEINRAIGNCFAFPAKGLPIKECEDLLHNFSEYYEVLDKAHLVSIAVNFSVKLKRMQEIDKGYSGTALVKYLHDDVQGRHIAKMLLDHSSKRLGKCVVSYRLIGIESLKQARADMLFIMPAQANYATHCEDNMLTLTYDGYECGYKAMLEGVVIG